MDSPGGVGSVQGVRVVTEGNSAGPVVQSLPWHPSVLRDTDVPFLLVQEKHLSHEGFLNCQRGVRESSD